MVREIVKSAKQTYTLNLPDDMVGKTVEVIAFEIKTNDVEENPPGKSLLEIEKKYAQYPMISHKDFRFNREEANDYE
jgi:hypothetical protein